MVVFGIQPQQTDWMPGLSAAVKQVVPVVCQAVLGEIGRGGCGQPKD
ncbi:MAG: hypothetical protein AB1449_11095 [Chloroflexota bacterium]